MTSTTFSRDLSYFPLSGRAALWIDHNRLACENSRTKYHKVGCFLRGRAIGCVVFPIFATFDLLRLCACTAKAKIRATLATDDGRYRSYQVEAGRCAEAAKACFRGILGASLNIYIPDLGPHHFIPSQAEKGVVASNGLLYSSRCQVELPDSIATVQQLVLRAKQEGKKIAIAGEQMSQGRQVLPTGTGNIMMSMRQMNQVTIDPAGKRAIVGPGATWSDVQSAANAHRLAVQVQQASNIFSVGGSVSVNCHGWAHLHGALSNTVTSLKVVDANGEVKTVRPGDELFSLVVGGYGLFGVIVEIEIELTDNLILRKTGIDISPEHYVDYFRNEVLPNSNTLMHLYRLSLEPGRLLETGIAVSYNKDPSHPTPVVSQLTNEPERGVAWDRILLHAARRLNFLKRIGWNMEKRGATTEELSSRNEIMRPPILAATSNSVAMRDWLQEFFVKGEDLADFLKELAKVLNENEVQLLNATVRYVKRDEHARLGYAAAGDRFAVVLYFSQSLGESQVEQTRQWIRKINDYVAAKGGTYYLPYMHFATREQFQRCYPQAGLIAAEKERLDPTGVFSNGLYEDYIKELAS